MKSTALKTRIIELNDNIYDVISDVIVNLPENSVLAITSKVLSLCEGRVVNRTVEAGDKTEKHKLAMDDSDYYIPPTLSNYNMLITIRNNVLGINSGLDESNSQTGQYILLPKDSQKWANDIWKFLREKYNVKNVGVIITDSHSFPLKQGIIGTCLAHCGFNAIKSRIGEKDLFGREIKVSQVNVAESLAVSAVLEMGEVQEQTPLCLIEGINQIDFQDHIPTEDELKYLKISMETDAYEPMLTSAPWEKGRNIVN